MVPCLVACPLELSCLTLLLSLVVVPSWDSNALGWNLPDKRFMVEIGSYKAQVMSTFIPFPTNTEESIQNKSSQSCQSLVKSMPMLYRTMQVQSALCARVGCWVNSPRNTDSIMSFYAYKLSFCGVSSFVATYVAYKNLPYRHEQSNYRYVSIFAHGRLALQPSFTSAASRI